MPARRPPTGSSDRPGHERRSHTKYRRGRVMRWPFLNRCEHINTRCIHGDEINIRRGRRVACLDCGRALDWPLPDICWVTNLPHATTPVTNARIDGGGS